MHAVCHTTRHDMTRIEVVLPIPHEKTPQGSLFVQRREDICLLSIATDIHPSPWIQLAAWH